jgi:hypothetical protein
MIDEEDKGEQPEEEQEVYDEPLMESDVVDFIRFRVDKAAKGCVRDR